MSQLAQRGYIQTSVKLNKNAREIHKDLILAYEDVAYSYRSSVWWIAQFKSERTNIKDSCRSGAPVTKSKTHNIHIKEALIEEDRSITYDILEELSGPSRGTLHKIFQHDLGFTKRDSR